MRHALALVALVVSLPLLAQDQGGAAGLPSRFRAAINGGVLEMSWDSPSDPAGGWEVLRSPTPFTEASLPGAQLIQKIAAGQRSFNYSSPDDKAWYYALLPLDAKGLAVASFISGRTVTAVAIAVKPTPLAAGNQPSPKAQPATTIAPKASGGAPTIPTTGGSASTGPAAPAKAPAASSASGAASQAPSTAAASSAPPTTMPLAKGIWKLEATVGKNRLTLSFAIGSGTGNVLVYRSLSPFSDATSLLSASLIASIPESTTSFIDYPIPGTANYYALVRESALKEGTIGFDKAASAVSLGPVGIVAQGDDRFLPATGNQARSYPLPSWLFAKPGDPGIGNDSVVLSDQTRKAIASILAPYPPTKPLPPAFSVLREDRTQARGGEEYALSLILQSSLKAADWKAAIAQLQSYLSLNRSPAVASRAHFYLGQAYAMTGYYRDAFFEFLLARDFHALETRPWLLWLVAVERG
ncbi:MAG TPA: hypothetical protein VMV44_05060 [Rectinemataceae bacterium]|nr:hypothetical protein [Rectinemataceae bacterium]